MDAGQGNRLHEAQRMGLGLDLNDTSSGDKPESQGESENPKALDH
jgi:hypothetical protein